MAMVRCEVSDGPRSGFKSIGVESVEGHNEYLAIEERFLVRRGDEHFLPVGVIGVDRRHQTSLVQLPFEADSGANRVWVRSGDVFDTERDEVPA